jgi:hypothetical protein
MLNYELARILIAERLRSTNEQVRQGRFRLDLAERKAAEAGRSMSGSSDVRACPEPSPRAKPALG